MLLVVSQPRRRQVWAKLLRRQWVSLVGADLSLSTASRTATQVSPTVVVIALLYLLPLGNLLIRRQRHASAGARQEASEVRLARNTVERELTRAKGAPARDVANAGNQAAQFGQAV